MGFVCGGLGVLFVYLSSCGFYVCVWFWWFCVFCLFFFCCLFLCFIHFLREKNKRYSFPYFRRKNLLSSKLGTAYSRSFQHMGEKSLRLLCWVQVPRCWHVEGLQGWPLKDEARGCPVVDTGGPDRPTTGHSWAPQPPRWCLWESTPRKGHNTLDTKEERTKEHEKKAKARGGGITLTNKINLNFPTTVTGKQSLCLYPDPQAFSFMILFSLPSYWSGGNEWVAKWVLGCQPWGPWARTRELHGAKAAAEINDSSTGSWNLHPSLLLHWVSNTSHQVHLTRFKRLLLHFLEMKQ